MRRFLRENGLSIAMFGLFAVFAVGQAYAGFRAHNDELLEHRENLLGFAAYLRSSHFWEALSENWESEFLQMAGFVWLTVFLRQRGSAESKPFEREEVDNEPNPAKPDAPWPVHRGGLVLAVYKRSLGLTLFLLFALSFALHGISGARVYNKDQLAHGGEAITTLAYMTNARFWFESLQNWQSEFLSIGAMVVLSIFLREKGSPESKPVDASHATTGE